MECCPYQVSYVGLVNDGEEYETIDRYYANEEE